MVIEEERLVVSGDVLERPPEVEPVPEEQTVAQDNLRSGIERRQKDGLGLLRRATTQENHASRALYNQVVVILLIVLGGILGLSTLATALAQPDSPAYLWACPALGVILAISGLALALRPERRRKDRRQ